VVTSPVRSPYWSSGNPLLPAERVTVSLAMPSLFFFSSRSRHTRLVSDWSSDVCSSDLLWHPVSHQSAATHRAGAVPAWWIEHERSEERRVGKECRSRWSQEH